MVANAAEVHKKSDEVLKKMKDIVIDSALSDVFNIEKVENAIIEAVERGEYECHLCCTSDIELIDENIWKDENACRNNRFTKQILEIRDELTAAGYDVDWENFETKNGQYMYNMIIGC